MPPPRISILLCGGLAALFVAGTLVAPMAERFDFPGASIARIVYRPLCHQIPQRSLSIGGFPVAVCARCTGLYAAGAAGILLSALALSRFRPAPPSWFAVAWLPTGLDVVSHLLGAGGLANVPRLLIALPPGFMAGLYLADAIADLATTRNAA